jgi:hypothetical protein
MDVALQQPVTLDNVVIFARAYEQCNASREPTLASIGHSFHRTMPCSSSIASSQASTPAPVVSSALVVKSNTCALRLSPTEIAQQRKGGKCFHYDELFMIGYHE